MPAQDPAPEPLSNRPDDGNTGDPAEPMTQRRVLRLALPIIGENLLQSSVGIIDTLMVARIGASALAGVGVSLEIVFFMIAILSSISIGGTVLISQAFGARDRARANQLARQTVLWGAVLSLPLGIIGFTLADELIGLFHTEPDVAQHATTYLRITGATVMTLLMTFVCGAVLRGAGDSRSPLFASLIGNLVKVVLSWGLIFGNLGLPRLEVAGSAWSTTIARGIGAVILISVLASGRRNVTIRGSGSWLPRPRIAAQLLRLGVPAAVEQMLMSAGFTAMVSIIALIGTSALAAHQVSFNSMSLAILPGFGFAIAATALVGQSIGARHPDHARIAVRIATRWALLWMTAAAVIYVVFNGQIIRIYTSDAAVISDGSAALVAIGLGLPLWALWTVNGGGLRGSGDTRTPMVFSVTAMWSAVAIGWVLVRWFDGELWMVWITFLFTTPLPAFGNALMFRRRMNRAETDGGFGAAAPQ
ncbi:MAG TPA: MATE family efflux transporter [Thermomicrobiales bacterium]|nr:MATE family efflux transporter [Thermomicrobiales bacterium]